MAPLGDDDAAITRAGQQAKRLALAAVLVFSFLFVGASVWNILPAVFGLGIAPLPGGAPGSPARTCAEGIRRLDAARTTPPITDPEVERACAQSSEGLDAWAALERLARARARLPREAQGELDPLEQDVLAHLPGDLR